jgi:hypothetical protein
MHYLYFPWQNYQGDANLFATGDPLLMADEKRYVEKYSKASNNKHGEANDAVVIRRGEKDNPKPLRRVKPDDVLIIPTHGSKDDMKKVFMQLRHWADPRRGYLFSMSKNDLATQIWKDGLNEQHRVIKLLACYGGGVATYQQGEDVWYFKEAKCLAELLAKALGKLKYSQILVGGYPGVYNTQQKQGKAPTCKVYYNYESGGQTTIEMKANDMLRWYDANGKQTTRPKGQ